MPTNYIDLRLTHLGKLCQTFDLIGLHYSLEPSHTGELFEVEFETSTGITTFFFTLKGEFSMVRILGEEN